MPITRILREQAIGAMRCVALDEHGRAVSLYLEKWSDRKSKAKLGRVYDGIVRTADRKDGGVFLDLHTGEQAFWRIGGAFKYAIGARLSVQVVAEARPDKLARVKKVESEVACGLSDMQLWQHSLKGGAEASVEDLQVGESEVDAAFETALAASHTLPGGGRLQICRTPALTSVDIDTAGRSNKGRTADRALAVNCEAAEEAARLLSLYSLGGLAVIDCIAPLPRAHGGKVKRAFIEAWRRIEGRKAEALAPSPFGLMEVKLEWGRTPISDILVDADGSPTAEAIALEGLRVLEREARAYPMARLTLNLPSEAHEWFRQSDLNLQGEIDARFGARISIVQSEHSQPDVTRI